MIDAIRVWSIFVLLKDCVVLFVCANLYVQTYLCNLIRALGTTLS